MADIKGKLKNDLKNMPYIRQFLHEYFDLGKDKETRSHTDGFRRNNANYWNKREICRFYLYSSIIWFCPVLEELGK
jgi:hypothetical protein